MDAKYLKTYSREEFEQYISLSNHEVNAENIDISESTDIVCNNIKKEFAQLRGENK